MSLRVIFGPTNVADQGPALAEALQRLGVATTTYASVRHPLHPAADIQEAGTSRLRSLAAARRFFRLAGDYDVVHLQSSAFLPHLSRPVPASAESAYLRAVASMIRALRRRGKTVAVTFHGSEVRPTEEIAQRWAAPAEVLSLRSHEPGARARRIRYSLAIARACDLVFVTTPDLLPLVPGALLSPVVPSRAFSHALASAQVDRPAPRHRPLRVLHAPSKPEIKGTRLIEEAIRRAQASGVPLDYRLVSGAPVAEVVERVLASDVVVDQLNSGWYGAVAVETMALGRPAIARIHPDYAALFSAATNGTADGLGPIHADAASLDIVLRELHEADEATWEALRAKARQTYLRIHDPAIVAEQVLSRYLEHRQAR